MTRSAPSTDEVDNKYIDNAITALMATIGVKEPADSKGMVSLVRSHKVKEAIKEIANYLGLPIEVNLSFVSNNYRSGARSEFYSSHLVKTDSHGRGTAGIIAQVSIPQYLPFYGSSGMVNFPISVRVKENCADHVMTFIGLMAHELSHVVLHSMRHKEQHNEFYTDLTAMMLGFPNIMSLGRKVVTSTQEGRMIRTQTTTYGYLSDSNFDFAMGKIEAILTGGRAKKKQLIKKISKLEKELQQKRIGLHYFKEYLAYLDKHSGKKRWSKKISQHDGHWIASFHQSDYTAEFVSAMQRMDNELRQFLSFVKNLRQYSDATFDIIQKYEEGLHSINFEKKYDRIRGAVTIMKKYVSLTHRARSFLKIKLGIGTRAILCHR
jgi:hypothetical protein